MEALIPTGNCKKCGQPWLGHELECYLRPPARIPLNSFLSAVQGVQIISEGEDSQDAFWKRREAEIAEMEKQEREEHEAEVKALRESRWRAIPATYREEFNPKLSKLPDGVIATVKAWQPSATGIGLMGNTGLGKTRLIVRGILSRLDCTWIFLPATEYASAVREQWSDDWGVAKAASEKLAAAKACRVLCLDDIGQESPSEAVSEAFASLIEHRTSRKKPILWTSNLGADALALRHKTRGAALVRRLKEFSLVP